MKQFKTLLFNRFRTVFVVCSLTVISAILLMIRLKLTQSFFLLFLVWNLFLAFIPYGITFFLTAKMKVKKIPLLVWFTIWLLFLPNAPYIITDFIHLTHRESKLAILDLLIISAFAFSGLIYYFLSVRDMTAILKLNFSEKFAKYALWTLPFLCGFGIYLGRFLRWNSWDIIQRPHVLLKDMIEIVVIPWEHKIAWLITLSFGLLLSVVYKYFNKVTFFRP